MSSTDEYLTTTEVQDILRIKRSKMYEMLRSGEMPHINLGHKSVRIARKDLDAYIATRAVKCS